MNFEEKVLRLCKCIPKGKVSTYKAIAKALNSRAWRAVGKALSKNFNQGVPCHRIIRTDRSIGGYRQGQAAKESKLKAEGIEIEKGKVKKSYIIASPTLKLLLRKFQQD